jgi:prephenate dehydrogenase
MPSLPPAEGEAPPFRAVGIVGLGLIGGSLALAARRAWPQIHVVGVDRGQALEAARLLPAFDAVGDHLGVLAGVDLVVLAAPVRQNVALLAELGATHAGPALVSDAGSTKRAIVDAARALPPHLPFVGGHPLAGAARGGLDLARADLFAGRPWLLTPGGGDAAHLDRLSAFVHALGALPRVIDADLHDRLLAFLSHLPQLTASALMHTVGSAVGDHIALAGPGLADTTRLASSPAAIWQDICGTNADAIRPALDALIRTLTQLRDQLDDPRAVADVFASAQHWRGRIDGSLG